MNEKDLSINKILNPYPKLDQEDSNQENIDLKYSKFLREN